MIRTLNTVVQIHNRRKSCKSLLASWTSRDPFGWGGVVRLNSGTPERAGRREQAPFLPFIWGSRGVKVPFEMQQRAFLSLIYYNRDQLSYFNQQYTLGKGNYLLYIIETDTAPAKEWNKNTPKRCTEALNFVGLL